MELDKLLQSIAANGYMDIEPLVVLNDPDADAGELIVLGVCRIGCTVAGKVLGH